MFRLSSSPPGHFIQIEVVEEADAAYAAGDIRFLVTVESGGFTGQADVWVLREEIGRFAQGLKDLHSSLKGGGSLRSVSPGELELEVLAVGLRGHLAVKGSLGRHVYGDERMYWHAVQFGFELEPQMLDDALRETWVANAI